MKKLSLKLHDIVFTIHRFSEKASIPSSVFDAQIYFLAKTLEETSIVLPSDIKIESDKSESDWRAFEVLGPLDFSLTGILSQIANVLADEKISIFAISTFDTDYILVKSDKVAQATSALNQNNFKVI